MTVYLGDQGFVELRRTGESEITVREFLNPDDVNTGANRFSVDINSTDGYFLTTGDRVQINYRGNAVDGYEDAPITEPVGEAWLLADHVDENGDYYPDWSGFVAIDAMGGIRLFSSYDAALRNNQNEALELTAPTSRTLLTFRQINNKYRCLAGVRDYQFTTERETIDTTLLGDYYRKQFEAGLISGQGTLNCFFNYYTEDCAKDFDFDSEFPIYLSSICVRIVTGAEFFGRFVLYVEKDRAVFYESKCIVTNATVSVSPDNIIESSIQFVTNGTIQLRVGKLPSVLLTDKVFDLADRRLLQEDYDPHYLDQ